MPKFGGTVADWKIRLEMREERLAKLIQLKAPQQVIDGEKRLIAQAKEAITCLSDQSN